MSERVENIAGVTFKVERIQSRWLASTWCECVMGPHWHAYHDARTLTVLRSQVAHILERERRLDRG